MAKDTQNNLYYFIFLFQRKKIHPSYCEIKGSLSSSWMNSPIPSFASVTKRVFVRNYWYENMSPVRSFAGKSSDFHGKRFAQVPVLQTATRMWKLSLHMCKAVHQVSAHSSFSSMKRLGVFLLPPGWDASPSQGYPRTLNLPVPIYTPEWILRHCESKVSQPRTHSNVPSQYSNPDCLK